MALGENDFRSSLQAAMTGGGDAETPAESGPGDEAETCPTCGASAQKIRAASKPSMPSGGGGMMGGGGM